MNEFMIDCVYLLDLLKGDVATYNDLKHEMGGITTLYYKKGKLYQMLLFLLTRNVLNCNEGRFRYNENYII